MGLPGATPKLACLGLHEPLSRLELPNNLGEFAENAGLGYDWIESLGHEHSVDKCLGIVRRIFNQSALVVRRTSRRAPCPPTSSIECLLRIRGTVSDPITDSPSI